jgi:hypothetical protein
MLWRASFGLFSLSFDRCNLILNTMPDEKVFWTLNTSPKFFRLFVTRAEQCLHEFEVQNMRKWTTLAIKYHHLAYMYLSRNLRCKCRKYSFFGWSHLCVMTIGSVCICMLTSCADRSRVDLKTMDKLILHLVLL